MKSFTKILRKVIIVVSLLAITGGLSGCSAISSLLGNDFDASGYVQGLLDSTYKGKYEDYLELTEDTEENAETGYQDSMEAKGNNFATYSGIQIISDDVNAQFTEISKEIYQKATYEVKEAVKVDGGYTVEVVISPMDILDIVTPEIQNYITEFNGRNESGEFADLSDEEFEDEYAKGVISIFKDQIENIGYSDTVSIIAQVKWNEDEQYYEVSDEDLINLDEAMYTIPE